MNPLPEELQLLDWKRRVAELYAEIRASNDPQGAWGRWRETRDELFSSHPQSAIPEARRATFEGLSYFGYDPGLRVSARVEQCPPERLEVPSSGQDAFVLRRIGRALFSLEDANQTLDVFWVEGYGGGVFVPFRDATSGKETYGAGRYLYDTIKGADLGGDEDELIFDFNFAYNPSCSYDPRWACPLAPPTNRLEIEIRAGERHDP